MIITIDGYAGSGKTSAADNLSQTLGIRLLHTGAMYRAAAHVLLRHGVDIFSAIRDDAAIHRIVEGFSFNMPDHRTILNGEDLTELLRSESIGNAASQVGTFRAVREKLKAEQRRIALGSSIICEGRDQGTSVFPDAPVKFFFTASVEVRAARRIEQLRAANVSFVADEIAEQIRRRDERDEKRVLDPLKQADDALRIDTSDLSPKDVLKLMLTQVDTCRSRA